MKKFIRNFRTLIALLSVLFSILACDLPALTTPFDVYVATTGNDSNDCRTAEHACLTFSAAVRKAVGAGTIILGPGSFPAGVLVNKTLTIRGAGEGVTTLTAVSSSGPVLSIDNYVVLIMNSITVSGGYNAVDLLGRSTQFLASNVTITNAATGISNRAAGRIDLSHVSILNNNFGILNSGVLTATATTFTGNRSGALGNNGASTLNDIIVQQSGSLTSSPEAGTAISNYVESGRTGRLSLTHSTIDNNNQIGILNRDGTVTIDNTSISNNRGTGISNAGGTMTLDAIVVRFNGNSGIYSSDSSVTGSNLQISRAALSQNGIFGLDVWGGTVSVVNTTILRNVRGGIQVNGTNLSLTNDTVARNLGIGLDVGSGTVLVRNSIIALALNSSPNCSGMTGITLSGPNIACDDTQTDAIVLVASHTEDAGTFVLPLQTGSPAIDAAGPGCPDVDQRGYGRPVDGDSVLGAVCDLGAYEFGAGQHLEAGTPGIIEILPSETPIVSVTPTAGASMLVLLQNANCRRGPGSVYSVLTSFVQGQSLQVDGRSETAPLWWQVALPNSSQHCWISNSAGTPDGDPNGLPVIPAPPTPMPTIAPESGGGAKDNDGDGFKSDVDCDDKNAKIHPGAAETAKDGVDSNCDGKDDS